MKKILSLILSVMMLPICNTYAEEAEAVRIAGRLLYSEDFDAENGLVLVKGSVPGCEGRLVTIVPSRTKWN